MSGYKGIAIATAVAASVALSLCAAEVTQDDATAAVKGWAALGEAFEAMDKEVATVETYEGADGKGQFHVVSFEGGGFAVTSGDTEIAPIIAYSDEGEFVASDENPLYAMLVQDIAGRTAKLDEEKSAAKNTKLLLAAASTTIKPSNYQTTRLSNATSWARLTEAATTIKPSNNQTTKLLLAATAESKIIESNWTESVVAPLCEARWNQGNVLGEPCYNYYTPSNAACGCVATAMAQIMYKFKYPTEAVVPSTTLSGRYDHYIQVTETNEEGTVVSGTVDWSEPWTVCSTNDYTWHYGGPAFGGPYDWDNMQARGTNITQDVERQAVGLLSRDCGISVGMVYSNYGAGSSTSLIAERIVSVFGYANAALRYRSYNVGEIAYSEQMAAMLNSFDIGSPCAIGLKNHAVIADGYGYSGDRLYIHFNWGWGATKQGVVETSTAWYSPPTDDETDNAYPLIGSIVYNISATELDSGTCIVKGCVVGEDGETPVSGATVTATDAISGATTNATTDANGAYTLFCASGDDYTITAESGDESATARLGTLQCTKFAVGNVRDLTLVLGAEESSSPSLVHRWSFDDLADSVGDSNATTNGTVTLSDGAATLPGGSYGAGYVTLGTSVIPDNATLEIWASENAVQKYSRMFDYGTDTTNYVTYAWATDANQSSDVFSAQLNGKVSEERGIMAPFTLGTLYHISWTFETQSDGSTLVRWQRRSATTGEVEITGSRRVYDFALSEFDSPALWLGHSQFSSHSDANATYDEVRVWNGVLSDAQLTASAIAGPDNMEAWTNSLAGSQWIYENYATTGMTGTWSPAIEYDTDGTAELSGTNVFTAASASAGTPVTVTLTTEMSAPDEDWTFDAGDDAQAAIRLGTNGVFQVLASSGWLDTTTSATNGEECTIQTVFDYAKGKYSVFIYDADSGAWTQMQTAGGTSAFSLANAGVSFLSSVVFAGETVFTSLTGTYVEITGFQAEDALTLLNSSTNLTWALAAWLNACTNGTGDVTNTVAAMSATDFANAYLLNLDVSQGTGYSFEITDVTMGEESVTLSVTLTRDGKAEQAVNGTLKFYTSADVATGYEEAGSATLSDDDFSAGDTATAVIPLGDDTAAFYKAVIE